MKSITATCTLALTLLLACSNTKAPEDARMAIGVLVKNQALGISNPSEYALPDGNLYAGLSYRVGQINLLVDDPIKFEPLVGKLVAYHYTLETDLNRVLKKIGPAPADYGKKESMQQLRRDWVAPETGFTIGNSTPEILSAIPYHRVYDLEALSGFSVAKVGSKVVVKAINPLKESIESLEVSAHYEGGRGKPNPNYVVQTKAGLAPGASAVFEFDASTPDPDALEGKKSDYYFVSAIIELQTKTNSLSFELFLEL